MSFDFKWPRYFSSTFYDSAKGSLEQALNSGQKLSLVADRIRVVDLNLGSIPPELDLLSIDELSAVDGSFKGSFMLSYSGDAFISLATNLHVNPLTQYKHALEMLATPSVLLTTAEMFVQLTLSHLRLRCVISLSFSKTTGLAMVFRDDPLESLNVSSSFDSFGVVQQFIQSEIENQIRARFRRDLPSLIHRLSQKWCADMAQQTSATHVHAPIVVEQVMHTPISDDNPSVEREPDDSLPHDFKHTSLQTRSRAGSRSLSTSPRKVNGQDSDGSNLSLDILQFDSDDSGASDTEDHHLAQSSATLRPVGLDEDAVELSYVSSALSSSPDDPHSQPSSYSSTWSRESQSLSQSPPRGKPSTPARPASRRQSGTDSPIISSLKRSTSNFATTFSKPPVPVSVENLRESLEDTKSAARHRQHRSGKHHHSQGRNDRESMHQHEGSLLNATEGRVPPLATRKRFHRLESNSQKTTPTNSPQKSRNLRAAKSRDRLRVRREDLDEYFPVTEDGASTTSTTKGNVFQDSRTSRPSLLNPDIPLQVPMTSGLLQAGKSDFPTKNSLRRTMMSSRLRDRGLVGGSTSANASSRRPVMDRGFFTSNDYS
ncbi:hypothetical protein P389DRAFT_84455 [Cystobasidium minutum MCA 4210]|uniref:uncharacterized protein n=1 Tax=Cystobasidium minutum MCA 4210 TaxID=1397322 RepID=UPI0034CDBE59|eukprot:jgi/Rhomi1/84455/CE84454_462